MLLLRAAASSAVPSSATADDTRQPSIHPERNGRGDGFGSSDEGGSGAHLASGVAELVHLPQQDGVLSPACLDGSPCEAKH